MRAMVYKRYGAPEVLQLEEIEKPAPAADEVLIKIHAVEATKSDCEMRSFSFQVKWFWLPLRIALGISRPKNQILGGYFAGEIESVGQKVTRFQPGAAIFGAAKLRMGTYAEYSCLPENYTIVAKPDNLNFAEAAAVPLGGLNALHFMRKANIKEGETVLVNGAGASIGTFALQIAKTMGAEVTAVDSALKEQMLRGIGADHFFDYRKEDFTKSNRSYDVIFDMVAASSYSGCVKLLNSGGRYLMGNPRLSDMLRSVVTTWFSDKRAGFAFAAEKVEELIALKQMIEAGKIKPVIDKIYPLEQAAEAHRRVETEDRVGIVVLSMDAGEKP